MKGGQDIDDVTISIRNGTYKVKEDHDVNKPSEDQDVNKPSEKSDDEKKDENMQTVGFFQVFRYADKVDVLLMLLGIICACGNGACLPALMIVFGDMTDIFVSSSSFNNATLTEIASCDLSKYGVTLGEVVADLPLLGQVLTDCNKTALYSEITSTFQQGLVDEITKYAIYFFIIGGVVLITAYGQVAFWRIASYRQAQIIRIRSFQNIMRMEIGWFDTHEVGELNTRLSDDINKISDGIGEKVGNFFQWTSTFVTGIIIGFVYGWKLSLVIMATSPLMVAGGAFTTWVMSAFTKSELQSYAKAGAVAEEVFGAIRTVVAFGGEQKESERYGSNLASARTFGIKKAAVSGGGMGLLYFVMFATYALAFWYGSKLVQNGEYTVGQMLIVFFCVLIGAYGLGNAAPNLQAYATARGAAYALWELLDRKSEIDSSSEEGKRPDSLHGNITFKNVHFNYPSRPEVPVLAGLSLDVKKGQTVALVGSSGCGKSTTVQLLQRFYDPLEGTVSIDDQEIRGLNIKWLREHIGMVSQEPVLFATTIKENILFGKDGVSDEDIVRAAQEANAHDFISKLPKKYDTMVGERGAQLSGGQKQRIAIARALVRDPRILLLDEATSALDTESEAVVQSALNKARMGRTTLVIAHRLSTIKNADHIYSLKDGKVFEDGTHDQLMEKGEEGIYYHLVMNQQSLENEDELGEETSKVELERQLSSGGKRHSFKRGVSRALSREESAVEEKEEDLPDVSMTRLMRVNAPEWLYMVLGCMAALINGAVMPAFAVIFAEIIAVFAKPPAEQERETNLYSAMFLVLGIVTALAMFFQAFMFGVSGENLTVRIRKMTFSAYMRQEIGFFDDHANGVGALCTRLSTDASAVQGATGVRVGSILRALSSIGTGLVIGFVYSWELTLLILAFIPFVVVSGALQMKILGGQGNKKNTALEEAGKVAIEGIENIRIVASLSKESFFINKYTELTDKPFRTGMKKAHFMGLAFSFSQALVYFAHAAAFWLGAYLVENGRTNFDDVFKVFAAIVFSAMAVGEASAFAPDYKKAKVAAARIFHMLDIEPSIDSASKEGIKLENIKGEVEFHDVQFSYPTRASVKVLKGLNLEVKPGQKVALVGSSGCGKSTTVSLLERFYDPEQGSVTIDGRPLKEINVQSGRSKIGIVQQEPILFDTSIKENIAYGDNFSEVSMDRVIQAAKEANIHNFIAALPEGYETNVGDKGAQLSGGQKQRVAIARALIRNPKILLLDEATSALDTESEKVVQEALEHAQEGRTSIVIAHRLSTIQDADKIVVIDSGVVAEQGTHSDLIAQQGLYYNLQQAQLKKI